MDDDVPTVSLSSAAPGEIAALARQHGAKGAITAYTIAATGSMEPTIYGGDVVYVAPANAYVRGDIIVYRAGAKLRCHRVVRAFADGRLMVRGDNISQSFDVVLPTAVLGKVYVIGAGRRRISWHP